MKQEWTALGWSFGLFLLMNVFAVAGYNWSLPTSFLWLATAWIIVSVILYFVIVHIGASIVFVLFNGAMAGLSVSVYYVHEHLPFYNMTSMLYLGLGLFIFHAAVMMLYRSYRVHTWLSWFSAAGIVYGAIEVLRHRQVNGSSLIFLFVFSLCVNLAMRYYRKSSRTFAVFQVVKLMSMLLFGGVLFSVITLVLDGEPLGFMSELAETGVSSKKKKG